ncbi:MAG: hypothetical protein MZV64_09445 [Ignavibacteriales bacterium]|nr:hypothetical protein [Ignavibacteriales bacterium]
MRLARTEHCPNQAFSYGDRTFGLQFHLEFFGGTDPVHGHPGRRVPAGSQRGLAGSRGGGRQRSSPRLGEVIHAADAPDDGPAPETRRSP